MYDDRVLEDAGDVMSWGVVAVGVQDCPDYPALLVIRASCLTQCNIA